MRAARLYGPRDMRLEEVPTPRPGPGEVLVRVRAVAICASDWRLYADGHAGGVPLERPIIQGHEFSGEIAALGDGVSGPPVGTRVAVEPSWHCGACDLCRIGRTNICRNVVFPSFPPRDGALAEYIACPAFSVCPLPANVTDIEGALTEPLGVALHAVRLAHLDPDERVAILGAGAIGMCTILVLRARGAVQVAVAEPVLGRREWPLRLGAGPVAASSRELVEAGFEADLVFECSGDNAAFEQAVGITRPGGRVIVVGIPQPERVSFDMSAARRRELAVVFSRRSRDTLAEAVGMVSSGEIDLAPVPVRAFPLAETQAAMELTGAQRGDALRAVVTP